MKDRVEGIRELHDQGLSAVYPSRRQLSPAVSAFVDMVANKLRATAHLDSAVGRAVFFRLSQLHQGDEINVLHADGTHSTFVVNRVARFDKEAFPTVDVFGPTLDPELRLVTCGGSFDFARRSYRGNTVVFASLRPTQ